MVESSDGINSFVPSAQLYLNVRAGFVSQGTTITAWCKANKLSQSSARLSLLGAWDGPKGKKLRARLIKASGLASLPSLAA